MNDGLFPLPGASARLSEDGRYRYELGRRWSNGPAVCWIMLNPSTADATLDDPTIRRCRRFSQAARMGAMWVVNLYALRTTYPSELRADPAPVGPENDDAIHDAVVRSRVVVAAWGSVGGSSDRAEEVLRLLDELGRPPLCLGLTAKGHPRHPLYVPASVTLTRRSVELDKDSNR